LKNLFIDTHTHLFAEEFDKDRKSMIQQASAQCEALLLPNINLESIKGMLDMSDQWPQLCFPMMGLHPTEVPENPDLILEEMETWLTQRKFIGIGETGTDLYWNKETLNQQLYSLRIHCNWAKKYNLPLILHSRDSIPQTLELIRKEQDGNLTGVFHCFTGTEKEAQEIIDLNFYLGIGGVVTYKNSTLPITLKNIDKSRIVLETDSPYLPPVPHRGQRNESAYIVLVAEALARIWNISIAEVSEITRKNSRNLFTSLPIFS